MKSALCIVGMLLLCSAGHARDEVAVLDLQARDFDETEALLLSQRLRDALQKRVDVIGRATLYERLAKNDMEASGCADDDCMSALGSAARVVWIVAGSVGPHGDKLRLEARLYSVSQGHLFSNAHRDADNLEQLRKREVIRLAEELWPSEGGDGNALVAAAARWRRRSSLREPWWRRQRRQCRQRQRWQYRRRPGLGRNRWHLRRLR